MREDLPIQDAQAADILMYRDAHFSGSFAPFIAYWKGEGRGITQNFSLDEIEKLAAFEEALGENIASLILSGADAERVARAKKCYKDLRDLFEEETPKTDAPKLIAELILAEEENVDDHIRAIADHGPGIIPFLIELLRSEEFYDPLFPGYGRAPELAAQALGKIGDKRAIIALFEMLDSGDFLHEETLLKALKTLGEPAKAFLLAVLKGKPITFDNERAAAALVAFKDDEGVATAALDLLNDKSFFQAEPLNAFLALIAGGVKEPEARERLRKLGEREGVSKMLKRDIEAVVREWGQ